MRPNRQIPTISDAIRCSRTRDGAILLDVQRGQMFCLNAVGSKILELLDVGCGEAQIADQVSAAYDVDVGTARADIRDFLEALSRLKILLVQDAVETRGT